MSKKRKSDIRSYFANTAMASKDTLPTVKNEHVESQQAEDLATGGDREKTEAKSAKDREKHLHTFTFHVQSKSAETCISCEKAGTVLEALKTSPKFTTLLRKNKGKDIVIEKQKPVNADIATHFPCWLIEEAEKFTIKFRPGNQTDPEPPETATFTKGRHPVTFYVDRKGGENCKKKKFLKNMSNTDISYLCIYACEGETAEEALRRDGRFAEIVFAGGSELENKEDGYSLEIDLPVTEQHDGKTFRLNMRKEVKKPSQSITETDSGSRITEQAAGPAQEQGESTPSSARSAPANTPAQEQEQERGESTSRSAGSFHAMPDSEELLQILRSQFKDLVKHMKERENVKGNGKVLELLREEYGKNIKVFWDVYGVKNLMEMSRSVCVLNSAKAKGTGFLLFDRFILTNAHVIKDSNDRIHANFRYESKHIMTHNGLCLPIKEVIAQASEWDEEKCWLDYALLELRESAADVPPPLLTQYGPPIQCGGVCIIGHPEGGVKGVDFCSVIESRKRESVLEKNEKLIQWLNWDLSLVAEDSPVITYDTCFFHGASGSPVFDARGKVVAMHTGGYSYKLGDTKSMIEYAIPLQPILKHFLKTMKERRPDILQRFIEVAEKQETLHPLIAPYTQADPDSPEPMEISAPPPLALPP